MRRGHRPGPAGGDLGRRLCRDRRAVQLQRPGAPLLPAQPARRWATCRSSSRRRTSAAAPATPSRSTCASGWPSSPLPAGASVQGGRGAARPAGAGDPAGRDLRPRRRDAPRGRRPGRRRSSSRFPTSSTSTTATASRGRGCGSTPMREQLEYLRRLRTRGVRLDRRGHGRADGGLLASRRGPHADRDLGPPAAVGPHLVASAWRRLPVGRDPDRGRRRAWSTLGEVVQRDRRKPARRHIFRRDGRDAEMVTAELAGAYEAPIYGMLDVDNADRAARLGRAAAGPPSA